MMHKRKIWLDSCSTKSALPRAPTYRSSTTSWKAINTIFYCNLPPEDVPLLKGGTGETYLKAIVQLSGKCCVQPGEAAGAHSLIQEIQIFDNSYQLLEQLENYNAWTATKFHYDQTRGLNNMRALMEGKSKVQGNFLTSLYWEGNAAADYWPLHWRTQHALHLPTR